MSLEIYRSSFAQHDYHTLTHYPRHKRMPKRRQGMFESGSGLERGLLQGFGGGGYLAKAKLRLIDQQRHNQSLEPTERGVLP